MFMCVGMCMIKSEIYLIMLNDEYYILFLCITSANKVQ